MRRNPPRHPPEVPGAPKTAALLKGLTDVYAHMLEALRLVWGTHRGLTVALAVLSLVSGLLPAGIAWVGAHIVDSVVAAMAAYGSIGTEAYRPVLKLVALEAGLVALLAEIFRSPHEPHAEHQLPKLVDDHPGGEGVLRRNQPVAQT